MTTTPKLTPAQLVKAKKWRYIGRLVSVGQQAVHKMIERDYPGGLAQFVIDHPDQPPAVA